MMVPLRVGDTVDRDELLLQADRHPVRPQRHRASARQVPRARRRGRVSGRPTRSSPTASSCGGTKSRSCRSSTRSPARRPQELDEIYIYPAKHFVMPQERIDEALDEIERGTGRAARSTFAGRESCSKRSGSPPARGTTWNCCAKSGFCPGIENYSRALAGRKPGEPPYTLFDFFPDDFLMFVDESHATVPQVRAMFAGDQSPQDDAGRARLPPADGPRQPAAASSRNGTAAASRRSSSPPRRPTGNSSRAGGEVVEQVIRPTGLVDPLIHVAPGPRPGAASASSRFANGPNAASACWSPR